MHFFDLESVHRGIHFSDNSKHISNICSVSIVQKNPTKQGCGAVTFFDGSGSGKAFRLWLRLQARRLEGSGSGQNVPAPAAPAPHIQNTDPFKSITFDPLRKNPVHIQTVVLCMHLYFHKINTAPDNTLQYMTALQRHGWQKWTITVPTKECNGMQVISFSPAAV